MRWSPPRNFVDIHPSDLRLARGQYPRSSGWSGQSNPSVWQQRRLINLVQPSFYLRSRADSCSTPTGFEWTRRHLRATSPSGSNHPCTSSSTTKPVAQTAELRSTGHADHLRLQPPEHMETLGLTDVRRRRQAISTLPKANTSNTPPIRTSSSAHATMDAPIAARAVDPAARAAVPPSRGTAQQAAHSAPTPTAAFQGLISVFP